mmetsp:Transcript_29574/g.76692  ORF Transcript_29574/g.76692 Transcript_29574/m.76692 type:complete len:87 (+) Transcript_29574:305-565(+)
MQKQLNQSKYRLHQTAAFLSPCPNLNKPFHQAEHAALPATPASQVPEPRASWWRGFTALLSQRVSFSLIDAGRVSSAYVLFPFSPL